MVSPLRAKGLEVAETSAPKQTDTTQRWKVGLRVEGINVPIRTKIEFSRRDAMDGTAFERVDADVLRPYGGWWPLCVTERGGWTAPSTRTAYRST